MLRGDVAIGAAIPAQRAVVIQQGDAVGGKPDHPPVLGQHRIFPIIEQLLGLENPEGRFLECLPSIFGMQVVKVHPADQFAGQVAQNVFGHVAGIGIEPVRINLPDESPAMIRELGKATRALGKLRLQRCHDN